MITKGKILWLFKKFCQLICREIYGDQSGQFVCWYWGLKGWGNLHRDRRGEKPGNKVEIKGLIQVELFFINRCQSCDCWWGAWTRYKHRFPADSFERITWWEPAVEGHCNECNSKFRKIFSVFSRVGIHVLYFRFVRTNSLNYTSKTIPAPLLVSEIPNFDPSLHHRTDWTKLSVTVPKSLFWTPSCVPGFE